jgi:DNA gyrase subunit A
MKLSKLAHLEVEKLMQEKELLDSDKNRIENILQSEVLLNKEIEKGFKEVSDKFGDERKTIVKNISDEIVEYNYALKDIHVDLSNTNKIYTYDPSEIVSQSRGSKGKKVKIGKYEIVIDKCRGKEGDSLLAFSNFGKAYRLKKENLIIDSEIILNDYLKLNIGENIIKIYLINDEGKDEDVYTITQSGLIKRTKLSEYLNINILGSQALKLKENDEIASVSIGESDSILLITKNGMANRISTIDIPTVSKNSQGVQGMKLNDNDKIVFGGLIFEDCQEIIILCSDAIGKKISIDEFKVQGRSTKGKSAIKLNNNFVISAIILNKIDNFLNIIYNNNILKMNLSEVPLLSRLAKGAKYFNLVSELKNIAMAGSIE